MVDMAKAKTSLLQPLPLLAAVIPLTLLAFLPSYLAGVTFSGVPVGIIVHLHAASMMLWLLMLVTQAYLVRSGRMRWHRLIGRSSYIIAPIIIVLFLATLLYQRSMSPYPVDETSARVEVFTWGQVFGFAACWALAIRHRKRTPLHMRYMVSTVFVVGGAIVARIIVAWFSWVPGLAVLDNALALTALILFAPLAFLIYADRESGLSPSPYWVAVGFLAFIFSGYFFFGSSDPWMNFVNGFGRLAQS